MKKYLALLLAITATCTMAFAEKGRPYLGSAIPRTPATIVVPSEADAGVIDFDGSRATVTGNTCNQGDDYDVDCFYDYDDTAPDVAFFFTPPVSGGYTFDLCGSSYDTKIGIFDAAGILICCNDDACGHVPSPPWTPGAYASRIECCELEAGHTYLVVVDGYSAFSPLCGDFVLTLELCSPCVVECPTTAPHIAEQEECGTEVNAGCNLVPPAAQPIECNLHLCGTVYAEDGTRDVDFYRLVLTEEDSVIFSVRAEFPVAVAITGVGPNCNTIPIYAYEEGPACDIVSVSACLPPGEYWLFVSTALLFDYVGCSDYVARVQCLPCGGCDPTQEVRFLSDPIPQCQCIELCPGTTTTISVFGPGSDPFFAPIVTVSPGCNYGVEGCDEECPPAEFGYSSTGWTFDPATGTWHNAIIGYSPGCVCVCFDGFLGVELTTFDAVAGDRSVALNWATASETNNDRFEIRRDGQLIAQIPGAGTSASENRYHYVDRDLENGVTYSYTLTTVDLSGTSHEQRTQSATPAFASGTVQEYALQQNYPNPFNPVTSIVFDMTEAGFASLKVYNLLGSEVATLASSTMSAGRHTVTFDAAGLPSGLYVYRLQVNGFVAEKKMLLMK